MTIIQNRTDNLRLSFPPVIGSPNGTDEPDSRKIKFPSNLPFIGFQCAILQQFCGEQCRIGIRHDLVVIAVHH
jgi:hypothetical protein